ncbi:hypothetical protein, partial [Methanobrevibacter sp.]
MSSNRFLNANGVYSTRNYVNSDVSGVLEVQVNKNTENITANKNLINNLKGNVQTNENILANHTDRITALENDDVLIKNSITNVNTKAVGNTNAIDDLTNDYNDLKLNYQEYKEDANEVMESLQNSITAINSTISEHTSTINNHTFSLSTHFDRLENLVNVTNFITETANQAKEDARLNSNSIKQLTPKVDELVPTVDEHKRRLYTCEGNIGQCQENITNIANDVASNEHRIENIELALENKEESNRTLIGYCTNQTRFLIIIDKLFKTTWGNAETYNQDLFNGYNDLHNRISAIEGGQFYLTNLTECPNTERLERFEDNIEYFDTKYPYNRLVLAHHVLISRINTLNARLYADDKNIDLNSCPFETILNVADSMMNALESMEWQESNVQLNYNGDLKKVQKLEENPLLTNSQQTKNNTTAITELTTRIDALGLEPKHECSYKDKFLDLEEKIFGKIPTVGGQENDENLINLYAVYPKLKACLERNYSSIHKECYMSTQYESMVGYYEEMIVDPIIYFNTIYFLVLNYETIINRKHFIGFPSKK